MPKKHITDPITDQEMAFARLVLAGTMTDRQAAEAVGLNPDTAAYTKAKPRVRAYMIEHHAAVREQQLRQEAEQTHQRDMSRQQILARLWAIANLSPDMTRSSITGQVKALAMIVAIEGLIPDSRATKKPSAPPLPTPDIYVSQWLREAKQAKAAAAQASPDPVQDESQPDVSDPFPGTVPDAPLQPSPTADPAPSPSLNCREYKPVQPSASVFDRLPDTRARSINNNRFGRRY